jgi:putative peptidoglycan lipid II flippase
MKHVARSSLIVAIFFGLDKVLGFVRTTLIARQFGLTYEIDVFNAANNIPDLLSALISGGALGVALIPVLSEYLQQRGRADAWQLFARILNLAFLVTAALAVLIAIFAGPLVRNVIAPGFPPEQFELTIELMRLDLLAILIFSISGLFMAGLQANQHFLLPAMAPGFYDLGQIFGVLVLARPEGLSLGPLKLPAYDLGIHGLVYGVIIGALLHLLIQVPGLLRYRFRWTASLGLSTPGVRQVLALMGPRLLTMFFLQLFFIARDNIASRLGEGAVTALNYGWFIMQVPETMIGTALAIALLPTLAEHMARGHIEAYRDSVNNAIRALLALTLPIAAWRAGTLPPLVEVVFGFDAEGISRVVWATRAYLLGLAGHSLLEIAARSFYARQDARTPLFAAALNALAYIVFAVALSRWLGAPGIALANSLAFTGEALLLLFLLNRHVPGLLAVRESFLRALLAALLGGALALLLMNLPFMPDRPLLQAASALAAMAAGALAALPFVWRDIKLILKL